MEDGIRVSDRVTRFAMVVRTGDPIGREMLISKRWRR
jgi:hypothetical protein